MITLTTTNGTYLVEGIQLRPRKFITKAFGDLILRLFFHRTDTSTSITISGISEESYRKYPRRMVTPK